MISALQQLLNGDTPDEVVWTADISYWISGQRAQGKADAAWDEESGYLQLCNDLGFMPFYWYEDFWLGEPQYDSSVHCSKQIDGLNTITRWETPIGCIEEHQTYLPISGSTGVVKHAVADTKDLDVLTWVIKHRKLVPAHCDEYPSRMAHWLQYDGLPSIALPRSPLPSFLYEWAGIQNGIYLLADEPAAVMRLMGMMEEQEQPVLDAVCSLAPPLVHFADNLSSDNMTGYYERYMAHPYAHRLERLHQAGVRCAVHLDGTIGGLLPRLIHSGFDAIEALTPLPAGDLSLDAIRQLAAGSDVILWGGVPGVLFAPPYTWDDMRQHVLNLLDGWQGTRFIVGVADQVPPDGDISYCRLISDLLLSKRRS